MKLSVILRTSDFRGDHAADVTIAYGVVPGETVEALVQRTIGMRAKEDQHVAVVEIRVLKEPPADDA